MSRLGKLPIIIPAGVDVKINKNLITVKGPKGELKQDFNKYVKIEIQDNAVLVSVAKPDNKNEKAYWGLYRSLVNNMVLGVSQGFEKKLEINGVGYKVALAGKKLNLALGFSHPVEFVLPEGITASVEANKITINGFDKQLVGETAARIRKLKKPEPYKGKGIKYFDEIIIRKEGKTSSK